MDGDGKQDVACSGALFNNNSPSFVAFQNAWNNWTVLNPVAGESITLVSINGVKGGAHSNLVGCNGSVLYWYQNPGGAAARTKTWTAHQIGGCNMGISLGDLNIGNRDIVIAGSNELDPTAWAPGLVYFDPGSTPMNLWTQVSIDSTYLAIHQINSGTLSGVPYIVVAEQEQASNACNALYNDHPAISGAGSLFFPGRRPAAVSRRLPYSRCSVRITSRCCRSERLHGWPGPITIPMAL